MRKSRQLICLLALLMLPACAGVDPNATWDPLFDFATLRTYDWAPKELETDTGGLPPEAVDRAVKEVVDAKMSEAGFTQATTAPTFRLAYYVGVDQVTAITAESYYGPGWGAYWGAGWDGPAGLNASLYDAGTITLDVISSDPSIGLVWRGIAHTRLTPPVSANHVEGPIKWALREMLESFPPEPR